MTAQPVLRGVTDHGEKITPRPGDAGLVAASWARGNTWVAAILKEDLP
jgi:hypothetical protein